MAEIPANLHVVAFDPEEFGRRMAAARIRRGLKPKQVAVLLEASTEKVNRWERGGLARPPARGELRLLAEVLQEDEDYLLSGRRPAHPQAEGSTDRQGSVAELLEIVREQMEIVQKVPAELKAINRSLRELARRLPPVEAAEPGRKRGARR